jgi:MFS family permease
VITNRAAILALLTALNLVNYLDRYLIMAVSTRIEESLGLTDQGTGWVTSAFMFGYFATSPIFGWLGDRYRRRSLIALGVAVWSVATALSGVASTYWTMIGARVIVGVGEASYATLAPTIIDDLAPDGAKNRWLAIFYVAIPVGSALGFIVGGQLDHYVGWRTAFFIASAPGLLLAAATLAIHEKAHLPQERSCEASPSTTRSDYAALIGSPQYVLTVVGYVAQTFALGGFSAWAAPFLYRKLCLELHVADTYFGAITVLTGLIGTAVGGYLGDRSSDRNRTSGYLRLCAWSSAAATPLALLAILAPSAMSFLLLLAACELALFVSVSPVNAAILHSVQPHVRATAMAASIFAIHLFGDMVSQPLVGAVSDAFGDKHAFCSGVSGLQLGLYSLPVALFVSLLAWWKGARARAVMLPSRA